MGRSLGLRPSPPNSSAFGLGESLLCLQGWVLSSGLRPSPPNSSAFGLGESLLCLQGWVEARAFGPRPQNPRPSASVGAFGPQTPTPEISTFCNFVQNGQKIPEKIFSSSAR